MPAFLAVVGSPHPVPQRFLGADGSLTGLSSIPQREVMRRLLGEPGKPLPVQTVTVAEMAEIAKFAKQRLVENR